MIPNIAKSGTSFRGAGKYYLHDKAADRTMAKELKPKTDDRVAFMDTRNCVHDYPEQALDEMWATADAQVELKRANGLPVSGRKCTNPVKTISLSWHPSEKPTPDQMIEAADSYLKHMGWDEHQAVLIGHNDTAHPHIHIILNRVHPETGLVLDDYKDKKRSQEWALEYEREHGCIWCEKRLEYDKARGEELPRQAANENLPHNVIQMTRPLEQQYRAVEQQREDLDKLERDLLKAQQRAEREAFFEDGRKLFKETRNAVWREVRDEYRPQWREHFETKAAKEAEAELHSQSGITRAIWLAQQGEWERARGAFDDRNAVRDVVRAELAEERKSLHAEQVAATRIAQELACADLRASREDQYKALLERQRGERAEMRDAHAHGDSAAHILKVQLDARSANQNNEPSPRAPEPANSNDAPAADRATGTGHPPVAVRRADRQGATSPQVAGIDNVPELPQVPLDREDAAAARSGEIAVTGIADAGAGAIGGLANVLADIMGEMFAPTPPEVRDAMAKAAAQAEAAKPVENPYLKHVPQAREMSEAERDDKARDEYWDKQRERRRER